MSGLYLASQSPRRTELLHQVGIDHTVVTSSYVEDNVVIIDPIEMVKAQALGKARCANDVPHPYYAVSLAPFHQIQQLYQHLVRCFVHYLVKFTLLLPV